MHFSIDGIFKINNQHDFEDLCLQIFAFQYNKIDIYKKYCNLLGKHPVNINSYREIPFLPIEFFKTHKIAGQIDSDTKYFQSSGTTGQQLSKHYVTDLNIYESSIITNFQQSFGPVDQFIFLSLLPNYLSQANSSLVYMMNYLNHISGNADSSFYLNDIKLLIKRLSYYESENQKVFLTGVSYALLNLVKVYNSPLANTIIMETGGMKGRGKEIIREELHHILQSAYPLAQIISEYGMTELLSQAYYTGKGFKCPNWMQILIRDINDPLHLLETGETGGINIIDLANVNSISFIATQDLGRVLPDSTINVLGRFDNSDIRGCNLLV
ncbi:MAG: acyl transferase [Bacteroidota bacterium]|nr:acyl transferase [Bacteroidota bacterium]